MKGNFLCFRLIVKISPRKLTWFGRGHQESKTPEKAPKPANSSPIKTNPIKPFSLEDDLELSITQGSPFKTRAENLQEESKVKKDLDLEKVSFHKFKESMAPEDLEEERILSVQQTERCDTEQPPDTTIRIDKNDKSSTDLSNKASVQQSCDVDDRMPDDGTAVSKTNQGFALETSGNEVTSHSLRPLVENSSSKPSRETENVSTSNSENAEKDELLQMEKSSDKLTLPPLSVVSLEQNLPTDKVVGGGERTVEKQNKLTLSEMQIYFDQPPFAEESSVESEENDSS